MRKKLFFSLTLANALVAMALWASPAAAGGGGGGRQDCCKSDGPMAYCCMQCCWLASDCLKSADC